MVSTKFEAVFFAFTGQMKLFNESMLSLSFNVRSKHFIYPLKLIPFL